MGMFSWLRGSLRAVGDIASVGWALTVVVSAHESMAFFRLGIMEINQASGELGLVITLSRGELLVNALRVENDEHWNCDLRSSSGVLADGGMDFLQGNDRKSCLPPNHLRHCNAAANSSWYPQAGISLAPALFHTLQAEHPEKVLNYSCIATLKNDLHSLVMDNHINFLRAVRGEDSLSADGPVGIWGHL